jgi:hypothetical protein
MPSASLLRWRNDRMPRLTEVDTHCGTAAALVPPNPHLAEESLRGYVLLLSGHFQGFCRDLYTECSQLCAAAVPSGLASAVQAQFAGGLKLDSNNPNVETIRKDFERFACTLDFTVDPTNGPRVTHLGHLNRWRNAVAHQAPAAPAGVPPLSLAAVQVWRTSCDGLASWLDGRMEAEMRLILGVPPW